MKRFISIFCLTALLICLASNVKAKADGITGAYDVLARSPGIDVTSIYYAYEKLNSEQKSIAHYIMGAYNNMYLTARGFSYDIIYSQNSVMEEFIALGSKVFNFAFSNIGWRSRVNEVFRQYMSGAIIYASQINTSFQTWYSNLLDGTIPELFIPYAEDSFDAWESFYNDPSGDGIASFGYQVSDWDSGDFYDFAFVGVPWDNATFQTTYNNFILDHNPVMYTNSGSIGNGEQVQYCLSPQSIPDALFVLRSSSSYQYYRYGFSDFTYPNVYVYYMPIQNYGRLAVFVTLDQWFSLDITTGTSTANLSDFINEAFIKTPFRFSSTGSVTFVASNWYPFINHVYLVDDLTTLSNPEEVFDATGLNIVAPDSAREPYIIAPNDRLLFTTRPVGYDDPLGFWDIIKDNSYDPETLLPATDDDFRQDIVNNTVINNYYVYDDDKINVPVQWFDNEMTSKLSEDSLPFIQVVKDCADCLGDIQLYIYGAIVLGLGGGILKKFLL